MIWARRRVSSRGVAAACLLAVSVAALCRAADEFSNPDFNVTSDSAGPAAATGAPEERDAPPQRVIVLSTGRVVLGDVVERPGGYLVREQFGSVVVPFAQVRLTAADLPEAYRKLSHSITEPTAGKHLSLAEWCFENRLYDSAQVEVKKALLLEPDRKEGREFLQKLQRTMENGQHPITASRSNEASPPAGSAASGQAWQTRVPQQPLNRSTSVAGLSPETVEMFVLSVQPLLMNKCANARCHGEASTNDFRLTPARRGSSGFRVFTERNASSVLRHIDPDQPDASTLLTALNDGHGETPRPLFSGPSADEQQELLRDWVVRAADDRRRHGVVRSAVQQQKSAGGPFPRPTPQDDPFLEQILAEERPDVFDPEVFNRLVHGTTRSGVSRQ